MSPGSHGPLGAGSGGLVGFVVLGLSCLVFLVVGSAPGVVDSWVATWTAEGSRLSDEASLPRLSRVPMPTTRARAVPSTRIRRTQ